jgi:hypothetical protein
LKKPAILELAKVESYALSSQHTVAGSSSGQVQLNSNGREEYGAREEKVAS